ncbi:GIY-YIG nuclease family protein [Marinifilum sp. D714]|uniref:GIY-YIG nuclease family protein n=1 Tax=Marinifilum sp. D714 TaxID=2937523 RepID=UPI0027CCD131|nr:GIY-YIG nuclease family protein [Marinifilum sp. D714]MDQ2178786.1 GIY-YIG nuclease family protein [Marinifilum sp. D714]
MRGKTIQVFLTDGSPRGIKLAEITSNIEQAIFIPRSKMNEASKRKEVSRPGIYFLFGKNGEDAKTLVYIGQSRNCLDRIKTHDQKKDFWNYAVLIISKTESFTQTHVEYLEELAITKATEANRYALENSVNPRKFKVPETMEADLLDNFDTIKILLSTLGFPLFDTIEKEEKSKELLFCKGKEALAEGEYKEDGFVVFKGSKANKELAPACNNWIKKHRANLIERKVLLEKNGVLIFQENEIFNSPSSAATQVLGRNANGWTEWKDKKGKTLDELKRK